MLKVSVKCAHSTMEWGYQAITCQLNQFKLNNLMGHPETTIFALPWVDVSLVPIWYYCKSTGANVLSGL